MTNAKKLGLILVTPVFFLLSHYLAVFPHEYAHSFTAWLLGFKTNPLNLEYGGTSWRNILLLSNIDENVDYQPIFAAGHGPYVALIAFAGAGIANGTLFILSLYWLSKSYVKQKPYLYYFLFWFNLMNLGNFYDYVPIHTFTSHSDFANIEHGLNISPWWIYVVLGYPVTFLIWNFFSNTLIAAYKYLSIESDFWRALLMIATVYLLFRFFGGSGISNYGDISYFLSMTSLLAIPGIVIALWPTRDWVQAKIKNINS